MKFAKIIGKVNPDLVRKAQEKLSSIFTELSLGYDNKSMGTGIGGDPLVFQLVYPVDHICDALACQLDDLKKKEEEIEERIKRGETISKEEEIPDELKKYRKQMGAKVLRTAATDGRRYYWNPQFVIDQDKLGLRIVVAHEAWHAIYMHPSRRGSRLPKLWNIAVDYRVNFTVMEDLKSRDIKDYDKIFAKSLGEYITLEEYAQFLRDPFNPPPRLAHLNPILPLKKMADPAYQDPYEDVDPMYYADPNLSPDMKRPENVYEYLLAQIPKCPKCGRLGKYKKPEEYKQLEKKIKEEEKQKKQQEDKKKDSSSDKESGHNHDKEGDNCCDDKCQHPGKNPGQEQPDPNGQPSPGSQSSNQEDDCCGDSCPSCGGDDSEYIDPFGAGETLDEHIDSDIGEEELAKRISDAKEMSSRMGGKIPGALEDELGTLISPKLTWEDFLRQQMQKKRNGYGKSDWLRPKSRPMFAGLYTPKKRDYFMNILCAYDCSGSMSKQDIAFGISQLQVIDERGEMFLVGWDTQVYWETMIKIHKADKENLQKSVVKGRGGTQCADVFNQYEEHCGKLDLIVIITDGFLYGGELTGVKQPPRDCQTLWLITSHNPNFKPPFGRVMHLLNE